MKVLTKNVKLHFECWNEDDRKCPTPRTKEVHLQTVVECGPPICPTCNEEMKLNNECFIVN
jgi:hypothetical protein